MLPAQNAGGRSVRRTFGSILMTGDAIRIEHSTFSIRLDFAAFLVKEALPMLRCKRMMASPVWLSPGIEDETPIRDFHFPLASLRAFRLFLY